MKKIVYLMLFVGALGFTITSCKKDKNDNGTFKKEDLVGKWNVNKMESTSYENGQVTDNSSNAIPGTWTFYLELKSDNSYRMYQDDGTGAIDQSGTYSFDGKNISLNDNSGEDNKAAIKTLTNNSLVIEIVDEGTDNGVSYKEVETLYLSK